jgi:ADP-ribosylglycohydrolase
VTILEDRIYGCLLGGLIGDAMGAPAEGRPFSWIEERYGPDGISEFDGVGTDDTAIREQLITALLANDGYVSCDSFADTFRDSRSANYGLWCVPVRNMFHKIDSGVALPVDAGYGNTPSSSSAMAISPMGIVNAGNPRQAALETFDVAGLIHSGPSGFCRDAASAIAAAVAQALTQDITVDATTAAATAYLRPTSAGEIIRCIQETLKLAADAGDYRVFRQRFYERRLRAEQCDSRETVPVALALFRFANGDPARGIRLGANFGRDADTIATMVGGLCGAFAGASALPTEWIERAEANARRPYRELADQLAGIVRRRAADADRYATVIAGMS